MPIIHSNIFLDESGDLGWKFDKPYRQGGSSRYLTIGYLILPVTEIDTPRRFVRDIYKHFSFDYRREYKASDLNRHHKEYICKEVCRLINSRPSLHLGAITVKKQNVHLGMRSDGNKLYNYMINLALLHKVQEHNSCRITRDNRSIKVASGQSLIDYLQTVVWYHRGKQAVLTDKPTESHLDQGLIFIDWITNFVWSKYEDKYSDLCNIISSSIEDKVLFFSP